VQEDSSWTVYAKYEGKTIHSNVGKYMPNNTMSHPRRVQDLMFSNLYLEGKQRSPCGFLSVLLPGQLFAHVTWPLYPANQYFVIILT
jgi:hypothetical protein